MTSAPPSVSPTVFASELVKLLLQVVWADHDVSPEESRALLEFARRSGLPEAEIAQLSECLAGRAPLSPPNLGLLKARRLDVLRAVKELVTSDLHLATEEEDLIEQISALLR
jgi:uncharacterized tellurite resistance protein B-like protein